MAISYDEMFYMPEELIEVLDTKILDRLVGKTLWYMTAREGNLLGAVIFSIMPDQENAILEYVYLKENTVGRELLIKSLQALKLHEIQKINYFSDDRIWPLELKDTYGDVLLKQCQVNKYHYFCYDYTQLEAGDIMDNLDEVERYTNELGYIDHVEDADAWDVRDILNEMQINYSVHEQNQGIGRFFLNEHKELIGVALGRSDDQDNYYVTDYYDNELQENGRIYRKIILGIIKDYLTNSDRKSYMEIVCNNAMMENFLIRNFGEAKTQGDVVSYSMDLQKYNCDDI